MPIRQSGRTSFASSGRISGSGFAIARMIGRSAIFLTIAGVSTPPVDSPRKTSAPSMTSSSVRALCPARSASCPGPSLRAPRADHALAVEDEDVPAIEPEAHLQVEAGDRRGTRAGADQLDLADVLADDFRAHSAPPPPATIAVPC